MKNLNILFAGFGGQGVLFAGKVVAYAALIANKQLSWLPSYGPEMRGGTANCSVCVSDEAIGSPLVTNPNVFIAMNLPSFDKFINAVEPGGVVIVDSSLIDKKVERDDVTVYYVPSTSLADENGVNGLSNMILIGKLFKEVCMADGDYKFCDEDILDQAVQKCSPPARPRCWTSTARLSRLARSSKKSKTYHPSPRCAARGFFLC